MTIQEQIIRKENEIRKLQYEVNELKRKNKEESIEKYQRCIGKYYRVDNDYCVRVKSIRNEEQYFCITAYYDEDYEILTTEKNDIEYLYTLNQAIEITEKEFMEFINTHINKIVKGE